MQLINKKNYNMWLLSPILTLHWDFLTLEQDDSRETIVFKYLTTVTLFFFILNFEKKVHQSIHQLVCPSLLAKRPICLLLSTPWQI